MEPDSDSELLRRYTAIGDCAAFARLVRRHLSMVRGVALRRAGGDAETMEDVVQSVFTILARKAASVPGARLAGWLHHAASLEARNAARKDVRYRMALQRLADSTAGEAGDAFPNPEGADSWEEVRPRLDEALSLLPERQRHSIILRFFENREIQEIAQSSARSEHAVRKELERSLRRLSVVLRRRGVLTGTPALAALLAGRELCSPSAASATLSASALAAASVTAVPRALFSLPQFCRYMAAIKSTKSAAGVLLLFLLALLTSVRWWSYSGSRGTAHGTQTNAPAVHVPKISASADRGTTPGAPEPEMKLERRGRLVQDREDGHWRLSRADMEVYLTRHGRDGENLALAFVMTRDPDYLEEAVREAEDPSAALCFLCLKFPDTFTEERMARLTALLGPDNPYPSLLRVFLGVKRGEPNALAGLAGLPLERRMSDPISPIPGKELSLLTEEGAMSLGDAFVNSRGVNRLNGLAFQVIGDELSSSAQKAAAAGDTAAARAMLQQGALLARQQESRWCLDIDALANSSEAAMLGLAESLGITDVWSEGAEAVKRELREERLEISALSMTYDEMVPTLSDDALGAWIPLAVSEGQTAMMRAMTLEEPARSEYLRNRLEMEKITP